MKLAVFENSADEKDIKKIIGFVGMIGDNDKTSEEKQKKLIEKMEKFKQISKENFAEKQKAKDIFKKTYDVSGKILKDKKPVIDTLKRYSNKPTWDEAPEAANILVYSPAQGWLFGTFEDAIINSLKIGWFGKGAGVWLPFNYMRKDESVKNWKETLEFRPKKQKTITVEQALEKIEKIIEKERNEFDIEAVFEKIDKTVTDDELKRFAKKLLQYMHERGIDVATRYNVKDGTSKENNMDKKRFWMKQLCDLKIFCEEKNGWRVI